MGSADLGPRFRRLLPISRYPICGIKLTLCSLGGHTLRYLLRGLLSATTTCTDLCTGFRSMLLPFIMGDPFARFILCTKRCRELRTGFRRQLSTSTRSLVQADFLLRLYRRLPFGKNFRSDDTPGIKTRFTSDSF